MTCCPNCGHPFQTESRRSLMSLTAEQKRLLEFIASFNRTYEGVSPSFDEMAMAMGLNSKSGIHRLVTALEERGHIERLPNKARSIVVIGSAA